ncbi:MAG TPA: DUF4873 domain-containing protein [Aldersonia sp.]
MTGNSASPDTDVNADAAHPDGVGLGDDYTGPAVVEIDGLAITVDARFRGTYQPIDGIYRWYGRLAPSADLDAALGTGRRRVYVHIAEDSATAVVGDRDFWGRQRVVGHGRPPYSIDET